MQSGLAASKMRVQSSSIRSPFVINRTLTIVPICFCSRKLLNSSSIYVDMGHTLRTGVVQIYWTWGVRLMREVGLWPCLLMGGKGHKCRTWMTTLGVDRRSCIGTCWMLDAVRMERHDVPQGSLAGLVLDTSAREELVARLAGHVESASE